MPAAPAVPLPPRPGLGGWIRLGAAMVVFSYVFSLALAAACVYLPFLLLTSVQPGLYALLIFAGGVVAAGTILWSLVPRQQKFSAPGIPLIRSEQPRLFTELESIALVLNEPMPAEVYLVPQANAFVAQHGGVMGFGSRRIIGLGLFLMRVLTVSQFRAVLAHEFGHYYSGDTRFGPWVYRARAAMGRTLANLASESSAMGVLARVGAVRVVQHVVVQVLVEYWEVFMRLTQMASREQELRADELAGFVAGSQALAGGLRTLEGISTAFSTFWETEAAPLFNAGWRAPLADGFATFLTAPRVARDVSEHVARELANPTAHPHDTHPPLRDRLAVLGVPDGSPPAPPADDPPATALLVHLDALEQTLLKFIVPQIDVAGLKWVSWERLGREVSLPSWSGFVGTYRALLADVLAGSLPEAVRRLPKLGTQIADLKGALLAPEQRTERAASLLAMALGLALSRAGWEICATPGQLYLERENRRLNPFEIISELRSGALTLENWTKECGAAGIAHLPLAPAPLTEVVQ